MQETSIINVNDIDIRVAEINGVDYISLTEKQKQTNVLTTVNNNDIFNLQLKIAYNNIANVNRY